MLSGRFIARILSVGVLLPALGGCTFDGLWGPRVKFERTVELQQPMAPGATLAASTASGSIEATGRETDRAQVVATIQAWAGTDEEAQELAEQTSIHFEGTGNRVALKAARPILAPNQSISISYRMDLPRQTSVELESASGSVTVADLAGNVKAHTASGHVEAARIQGSARLSSASGSVQAENVGGGDIDLETASGGVRLSNASNVGACELHSSSGPVTAGKVEAKLIRMSSTSGHVALTDAQAQEMRLHATSGGVRAEDVTCARLNAESVSGHVTVAFSRATPSDVVADASAGSGNIDVVAAKDFSGHVVLSSSSGSVETDLPVTVQGRLSKRQVSGFVGKGSGSLSVRTTSGSIRVR
jgi:hypothetical protein